MLVSLYVDDIYWRLCKLKVGDLDFFHMCEVVGRGNFLSPQFWVSFGQFRDINHKSPFEVCENGQMGVQMHYKHYRGS